jgi:hypothetical protein
MNYKNQNRHKLIKEKRIRSTIESFNKLTHKNTLVEKYLVKKENCL